MASYRGMKSVQGTIGTDIADFSSAGWDPSFAAIYYANGGNDQIIGTNWGDVFFLGSGNERVDGRGGSDQVVYANSPAAVVVNLNRSVQQDGWAAGDTLISIEGVTGSAHDDTLIGNNLNNTLIGGDGNDFITGNGGNDFLKGGNGSDTFYGLLSGNDQVTGGGGKDSFAFAIGTDDFNLTITDWNPLIWDDRVQTEPSETEVRSSVFELFKLVFWPESGVTTQAQADGSVKLRKCGP